MPIEATQVFTPNDFPTYTYIQRQGEDLEQYLRDALYTPNIVASLSGPSKSGKTVLVERVVGEERLILVSGAEIRSVSDLWDRVLDNLDTPATVSEQLSTADAEVEGTEMSAGVGIPGLGVNLGGKRSVGETSTAARARTETRNRGALQHVQDIIGGTNFVVFIDDFHYIEENLQVQIAQQIKAASERGIRVAVALVPHRSDDVVRNNPELRGRVRHIDTAYWTVDELMGIALTGFPRLKIAIDEGLARELALEACGSPQLMQQICLQACFRANYREEQPTQVRFSMTADFKSQVMEQSASTTDYSSLVRAMHTGPRTHGTVRAKYRFIDGSEGDMYRAVLLAFAQPPPRLDIPYGDLMARVQSVCMGSVPPSTSVMHACRQIATIARDHKPDERIIEWDNDTLSIVDPYLLFYLRGSRKLKQLGTVA